MNALNLYAVRVCAVIALWPAMAVAQAVEAPPPPPQMSCDDLMINAQLKLQTVIDYEIKTTAHKYLEAAKDAISRNDPVSCKVQVDQAMRVMR